MSIWNKDEPLREYASFNEKEQFAFKHFLVKQFESITSLINHQHLIMQVEVQAVLDAATALDTKVDALKTSFANQQTALALLQAQIATLSLSDADKQTLSASVQTLQTEGASIDTLLNPVPPAPASGS